MCILHKYASACTRTSLVPRPFEEEEKGPGTHCLRMLRYPKNLGGLDTIVNYSASLIRIPVCDICISNYYVHVRATHRPLYSYSASLVSIFIHVYVYAVNLRVIFTVSFTENMTYAQAVCTRPFLLLLKGPEDEASTRTSACV